MSSHTFVQDTGRPAVVDMHGNWCGHEKVNIVETGKLVRVGVLSHSCAENTLFCA